MTAPVLTAPAPLVAVQLTLDEYIAALLEEDRPFACWNDVTGEGVIVAGVQVAAWYVEAHADHNRKEQR